MSDIASKEDFFASCGEHKKEPFTLPNGKRVFVEEITAFEHERFQQELAKYHRDKGGDDTPWDPEAKARLIIRCVTSGDSKPLFGHADLKGIASMPVRVIEPLFRLCQQVNGLDREAQVDLKKNSGAGSGQSSE
jgi:hypothetical protein